MIRARVAALRARWDSICTRCGRCCYQKEWHGRKIVTDWSSPCRHLDESSRLCTVYTRRFRECGECRSMTIFHALFASYLPPECGYVKKFRGYRRLNARPAG
jgi:uncharacterized protein